jgi:hypothetical protein
MCLRRDAGLLSRSVIRLGRARQVAPYGLPEMTAVYWERYDFPNLLVSQGFMFFGNRPGVPSGGSS